MNTMNIFEEIRKFAQDLSKEVLSLPKELSADERREYKKVVELHFPSLKAQSYGVGDDRILHIIRSVVPVANGNFGIAPPPGMGHEAGVDIVNGNTEVDVELFKELMVQTSPTMEIRRGEVAASVADSLKVDHDSATMPPGLINPASLSEAIAEPSSVMPTPTTNGGIKPNVKSSVTSNGGRPNPESSIKEALGLSKTTSNVLNKLNSNNSPASSYARAYSTGPVMFEHTIGPASSYVRYPRQKFLTIDTLDGSSVHSGLDSILKGRGLSLRSPYPSSQRLFSTSSVKAENSKETTIEEHKELKNTFIHISDVIPVLKKASTWDVATLDVGSFMQMCDDERVKRKQVIIRSESSSLDKLQARTTSDQLYTSTSTQSKTSERPMSERPALEQKLGSRTCSKKEFIETWDTFERGEFPGLDAAGMCAKKSEESAPGANKNDTTPGTNVLMNNLLTSNDILTSSPVIQDAATPSAAFAGRGEPTFIDIATGEADQPNKEFPSWMYQKPLRNEYLIGQIVELTDCAPPYNNLRGVVCNIVYEDGICYDIVLENTGGTVRVDANRPDLDCVGFDNANMTGLSAENNTNVPWLNLTIPENLLRPVVTDLNIDAAPFVPTGVEESANAISLQLDFLIPPTGLELEQRQKYQYLESEFLLNGIDAVKAVLDAESQKSWNPSPSDTNDIVVSEAYAANGPDLPGYTAASDYNPITGGENFKADMQYHDGLIAGGGNPPYTENMIGEVGFEAPPYELQYGDMYYDMSYLDIQMDTTQYYNSGHTPGVDIDENQLYATGNPFSSQPILYGGMDGIDSPIKQVGTAPPGMAPSGLSMPAASKSSMHANESNNNNDGIKKKTNYSLFNESPPPPPMPPPPPPVKR